MDVIRLISCKNRCLTQFQNLNSHFLPFFEKGDFSGLDQFQSQRTSILKALELFDRKLSTSLSELRPHQKSSELLAQAKTLLSEQDQTLKQILIAEESIIKILETELNHVNHQLSQNQKSSELVQKFKSTWVNESGETFDITK